MLSDYGIRKWPRLTPQTPLAIAHDITLKICQRCPYIELRDLLR